MSTSSDCTGRRSWSVVLAVALAALGIVRLASDLLTDVDPTWVSVLGRSPLRLLARTTDGSLLGDLNVQYFKVLAVPCGLAVIFLINGGLTGGIAAAQKRWSNTAFRLGCIASLLLLCTLCEVEKAFHVAGLPTALARGERAWLNHVVHSVGGILAYPLSLVFRYRSGHRAAAATRAPRPA